MRASAAAVAVMAILSLQCCLVTASEVSKAYYTPIINMEQPGLIQQFPILLDAEGSIGSTTLLLFSARTQGMVDAGAFGNASGILFLMSQAADVDKFKEAPHKEYIALMSQDMFQQFSGVVVEEKHCTGILVFDSNANSGITRPASGSPSDPVPNHRHGLAFADLGSQKFNNDSFYPKQTGDSRGAHWSLYEKPVMFLEEEFHDLVFSAYNNSNLPAEGAEWPGYFMAGAQLSMQMQGAGDAETCLRRDYCSPLGGFNTYGTVVAPAKGQQLFMVATQIDSNALFHDRVYGLNAETSGIITTLAAASILATYTGGNSSKAKMLTENNKNIMFNLFDGEAYGYIGSSAIASRMRKDKYPNENVAIKFEDIAAYVEIGQVLAADIQSSTPLYAYTYGDGSKNNDTALVASLKDGLGAANLEAMSGYQVPPSSLRSLLYEMSLGNGTDGLTAAVITDFDENGYKNKYYHSRLDDLESNGGRATVTAKLKAVAEGVAKGIWKQATGEDATLPPANETLIDGMLECYSVTTNCTLINLLLSFPSGTPTTPINRYVGVSSSTPRTNAHFAYKMLATALSTGFSEKDNLHSGDDTTLYCMNESITNEYPFPQSVPQASGNLCIDAYVYNFRVWSPAFNGNELKPLCDAENLGDSGCRDSRHSSWTESVWNTPGVSLISIGSPRSETTFLAISVLYAVAVFVAVWLASSRFEQNILRRRRVSLLANS